MRIATTVGVVAVVGLLSAAAAWLSADTTGVDPAGAHPVSTSRPTVAAPSPVAPARVTAPPMPPPPPVPPPCRGTSKVIRVSITAQRAWLCDGATLHLTTPVTTGADLPGHRTRVGTWHIQGKQTHRWLGGPGYSVRVHWWLPYDVDFGLHDADWQTMPFGSAAWRTRGSHGCVHVPHGAMKDLYSWARRGTTVIVER